MASNTTVNVKTINSDILNAGTLKHLSNTEIITTTTATTKRINLSDSGKTFLISTADGTLAFNLPPVASSSGLHLKIVFVVVSDNDVTIVSDASNIIMSGTDFTNSGASQNQKHTTGTGTTLTVNADTANAVVGDTIELFCDGTNYIALCTSANENNSNRIFGIA